MIVGEMYLIDLPFFDPAKPVVVEEQPAPPTRLVQIFIHLN